MQYWQKQLAKIVWDEGKHERVMVSSYRHAVVVACSLRGRQKAVFVNGEHPYFAYTELLTAGEKWISHGNNIVPVLPDDRLIMVVEQRPVLARYEGRPTVVEFEDRSLDLKDYGPYSSLEFPGGAIEPGESFTAGFLRELQEETEVENQKATLYRRLPPIYPFGSDIALQSFLSVIFLSGYSFSHTVKDDGGLIVFALTYDEVERNIKNGIIASVQAALLGWAFYREILTAKLLKYKTCLSEKHLTEIGYLSIEEVEIKKPQ